MNEKSPLEITDKIFYEDNDFDLTKVQSLLSDNCNISSRNQASINLFGSLDFQLVGVKSKWNKTPEGWEDELLFQLLCD